MSQALEDARDDEEIGVIILTGEGEKAFCSGGDQKIRGNAGYKDAKGVNRLNVLDFQRQIRTCPKPVIAMVAGYAVLLLLLLVCVLLSLSYVCIVCLCVFVHCMFSRMTSSLVKSLINL